VLPERLQKNRSIMFLSIKRSFEQKKTPAEPVDPDQAGVFFCVLV